MHEVTKGLLRQDVGYTRREIEIIKDSIVRTERDLAKYKTDLADRIDRLNALIADLGEDPDEQAAAAYAPYQLNGA